jgi:hypothetical protein
MRRRNEKARAGRYAYEGLERVMHEKARLGLLTSLAAHPDGLSFTDLKELCALTDGNLADYVAELERVVSDAARATGRTRRRGAEPGFSSA